MVRVKDIWQEAKKIIGNADEGFIFRRITDAVELLGNKGDFDPQLATLDIKTFGRVVTLPPEVEVVLATSICGHPAVARDEFFLFHLNGPGQKGWGRWGGGSGGDGPFGPEIRYEWMDLNDAPTYRNMSCPDKLTAYCVEPEDVNAELWVYGFDQDQNAIRTRMPDGTWQDGWKVPVFQFVTALPSDAPIFSRITRVKKSITAGPIRLATVGNLLLGVYQSNENLPMYRKIMIDRPAPFITIRCRLRNFSVHSVHDLIPVDSSQAIIMMLRALKFYDTPGGIADAEACEATAVRWASEKQFVHNPPVVAPIQVLNSAPLLDAFDYME